MIDSSGSVPPGAGASAENADKMRSVEDLLEQLENSKGAQAGTVRAVGKRGGVSLQHDLAKIHENYPELTDAPFGEVFSKLLPNSDAKVATTPAAVEYRTKNAPDSKGEIVSNRSKKSVAANEFTSREKPVTLRVNNGKLLATQVSGIESQLPVKIKMGDETRELNVGEVSRFDNFDVTILASSNNSTKPGREGPYAPRLQIMPVQ
jgi:hypothetical protein